MNMTEHTPGPWIESKVSVFGRDMVVYRRTDGAVMEVALWRDCGALGRLLTTLWKPQQGRKPGPVASAAIAKAQGAQS
jgi:hypothetical protein